MEDIVEFKECCLCLERFTDPRILPCLHTFCLKCLEKTGVMKPEQLMLCPACGSEFIVPLEGLTDLPRNLLAEKVTYDLETFLKATELEKPLCNVCTVVQDKEIVLAEKYCIICEEKMCLPCGEEHGKQKEHLVVALKTKEHTENREEIEGPRCLNHQTEMAELYCTYCKKVICTKCLEENHNSHNSSKVADAAVFTGKLAEEEYENISVMKLQFQQSSEKLQREKLKFMETARKMETEIRKRCEEIKELVINETKRLLQELAVLRKERLEEIEMEQRRIEKHFFTLEKFKEYCAQIKNNTIPSYTCEAESAIRSTAGDLKTQQQSRIQSRILHLQVSFQKENNEKFQNDVVGRICVSCPHATKLSCPLDTSNKLLYGMAHLQDKLYVLSDSLLIHRAQKPFDRVEEIKIAEIKSPANIVSCPKTPCLYIFDKVAACIWKVTIPEHQVRCWLNKVNQQCAMTASSSGEVLMVRNNPRGQKPVVVDFYNQHGILTRQLHLPKAIQSLQRVYETQAESYIGLGNGKVYKLRTNGSIIAEFKMSKYPECYSVFLASGAAGYYYSYSNISLLGLNLEWNDDWSRGVNEERLCYIKESKQLAVLESYVIKIYDVIPQ